MSMTIAVAGKGGTGKTTISALLAQHLTGFGTVLAIDADPSVNLHMALGLLLPETVGDIREELLATARSNSMPPGMNKYDWMDLRVREALVESKGLDLLAMGRPEGPGCYCAANHILRRAIDTMAGSYDYVIVDNEAGMEHISRQTTRDVQVLLLVTDPTIRGIVTAGRMQALLHDLRANADRIYLVINRVNGALSPEAEQALQEQKLQLLATVPADPQVGDFDASGRPLVELPSTSPVQEAVRSMAVELGLAKATAQAPSSNGAGKV